MIKIDIDNFHRLSKSAKAKIFYEAPEDLIELVKEVLSAKRLAHSLSVADVAISLAKRHHVDQRKAYIAGILHDITKYMPIHEQLSYLKIFDKDKVNEPEPILHSYSAIYYIKEKLNLYDGDILNAIYHHTDGRSNAKLAKIIYIADKREPLRHIDDDILKEAYLDLDKAFERLKIDVKEYVERNGK